jgi:hypothetical protein
VIFQEICGHWVQKGEERLTIDVVILGVLNCLGLLIFGKELFHFEPPAIFAELDTATIGGSHSVLESLPFAQLLEVLLRVGTYLRGRSIRDTLLELLPVASITFKACIRLLIPDRKRRCSSSFHLPDSRVLFYFIFIICR